MSIASIIILPGFGDTNFEIVANRVQVKAGATLVAPSEDIKVRITDDLGQITDCDYTIQISPAPTTTTTTTVAPLATCGTPNANPTMQLTMTWTSFAVSAVSTTGTPTTITATGHPFANGDTVALSGLSTTPDDINGSYVVSNVTANTFDITANVTAASDPVGSVEYATFEWNGCSFAKAETKEIYAETYAKGLFSTTAATQERESWFAGGTESGAFRLRMNALVSAALGYTHKVNVAAKAGFSKKIGTAGGTAGIGVSSFTPSASSPFGGPWFGAINTTGPTAYALVNIGQGYISPAMRTGSVVFTNGITMSWDSGVLNPW